MTLNKLQIVGMGFLSLLLTSLVARAEDGPVVVELFTSQGCNSCPAADEFLGELASRDEVIAIGCHVTYWDYLGWRDTLSSSYCDQRQSYYARRITTGGNYTPQMVINGRYEGVGSRRARIENLIASASTNDSVLSIKLTLESGALMLTIDRLELNPNLRLDVIGLGDEHRQAIGRGENKGRTIVYSSPLLAHYRVTLPQKDTNFLKQKVSDHKKIKTWLALANDDVSGKIVAVGKLNVQR